jgi:integration host factor subunit alpha
MVTTTAKLTQETTTRADLVDSVYESSQFTRSESTLFVDTVLETLYSMLEEGKEVRIPRFGTFFVRQKGERIGRNPKTGKEVMISERKVVLFKPSTTLKKSMDGLAQKKKTA